MAKRKNIIEPRVAPTNVSELQTQCINNKGNLGVIDTSSMTDFTRLFDTTPFNSWKPADFNGIEQWNTSNVTNMNSAFANCTYFNNPLTNWDTSNVTNMSKMFISCRNFNQNINHLNVSNVTTMDSMFSLCSVFNQPLDKWNVGKVTDMDEMFWNAKAFDQNISTWNVSSVKTSNNMFLYCPIKESFKPLFGKLILVNTIDELKQACLDNRGDLSNIRLSNQITSFEKLFYKDSRFSDWREADWTGIGSWNTSNITNMAYAFNIDTINSFNADLSNWDVSNVTNMTHMFHGCQYFNSDLSKWDVSKVTNMYYTFYYCTEFNKSINTWNVSNVTDMSGMFYNCRNFNQPLDMWDTSSVTDMSSMFSNCWKFNQNINSWNVSNVTDMHFMFSFCNVFNQPLDAWDVSSVTDMTSMFSNCANFNQNISSWNTSNVKDIFKMFNNATSFNQDISNWDISKASDLSDMFNNATSFNQPIGKWDLTSKTSVKNILNNATSFQQYIDTWKGSKLTEADITGILGYFPIFFSDYSNISLFVGTPYELSLAKDFSDRAINNYQSLSVVSDDPGLEIVKKDASTYTLTAKKGGTLPFKIVSNTAVGTAYKEFTLTANKYVCKPTTKEELQSFCKTYKGNLGVIDTSIITDMRNLFDTGEFRNWTNDDFAGIEEWDTISVTDMAYMFNYCSSFNRDISNWNTSKVEDMEYMFNYCRSFNQPIGKWNVSSVVDMTRMFCKCESFNQDLSTWDTSSVNSIVYMFSGCTVFNSSVNDWNISKVNNLTGVFESCTSFNQPLDKWDTSFASTIRRLFYGCTNFNQNINNWDTSRVNEMEYAFYRCSNFNQPLNEWNTANVTTMNGMFQDATSFNQDIHNWNVLKVTAYTSVFTNCPILEEYKPLFGITVIPKNITELRQACRNNKGKLQNIGVHLISDFTDLFNTDEFHSWSSSYFTGVEQWAFGDFRQLNFTRMFAGCVNFSKPVFLNLKNKELIVEGMFDGCTDLYRLNNLFVSNTISGSAKNLFNNCTSLIEIAMPTTGTYLDKVTDVSRMFYSTKAITIDLSKETLPLCNTIESVQYMYAESAIAVSLRPKILYPKSVDEVRASSRKFKGTLNAFSTEQAYGLNNLFNTDEFHNWTNKDFNGISKWDVSKVGDLTSTFQGCVYFNQSIDDWAVGKCENFTSMFQGCTNYNQPMHKWGYKIRRVATYSYMFKDCKNFNQDINDWIASKTSDATGVFDGCPIKEEYKALFNYATSSLLLRRLCLRYIEDYQSIEGIVIAPSLTSVSNLFNTADFHNWTTDKFEGISTWDLSSVNDFTSMFEGCINFNSNILFTMPASSVNIITKNMFKGCSSFNSTFNVNNTITDASGMFYGCSALTGDGKNAYRVKGNASYMFYNCMRLNKLLLVMSNEINDFSYTFYGCSSFNQPFPKTTFNLPTNMDHMFENCVLFEQDLRSAWDIRARISHVDMFKNCPIANIHKPIFDKPNNIEDLRLACLNNKGSLDLIDISLIDSFENLFNDPRFVNWDNSDWNGISGWNTANISNFNYTFKGCVNFNQNISTLFARSSSYTTIGTFQDCTSFNQPVEIINTRDATETFMNCTSLTANVKLASISKYVRTFKNCTSFDVPLKDITNVSNGLDFTGMFQGCTSYNQPLPDEFLSVYKGDYDNPVNISYMFYGCTSLRQESNDRFVVNQNRFFNDMAAFNDCPIEPLWLIYTGSSGTIEPFIEQTVNDNPGNSVGGPERDWSNVVRKINPGYGVTEEDVNKYIQFTEEIHEPYEFKTISGLINFTLLYYNKNYLNATPALCMHRTRTYDSTEKVVKHSIPYNKETVIDLSTIPGIDPYFPYTIESITWDGQESPDDITYSYVGTNKYRVKINKYKNFRCNITLLPKEKVSVNESPYCTLELTGESVFGQDEYTRDVTNCSYNEFMIRDIFGIETFINIEGMTFTCIDPNLIIQHDGEKITFIPKGIDTYNVTASFGPYSTNLKLNTIALGIKDKTYSGQSFSKTTVQYFNDLKSPYIEAFVFNPVTDGFSVSVNRNKELELLATNIGENVCNVSIPGETSKITFTSTRILTNMMYNVTNNTPEVIDFSKLYPTITTNVSLISNDPDNLKITSLGANKFKVMTEYIGEYTARVSVNNQESMFTFNSTATIQDLKFEVNSRSFVIDFKTRYPAADLTSLKLSAITDFELESLGNHAYRFWFPEQGTYRVRITLGKVVSTFTFEVTISSSNPEEVYKYDSLFINGMIKPLLYDNNLYIYQYNQYGESEAISKYFDYMNTRMKKYLEYIYLWFVLKTNQQINYSDINLINNENTKFYINYLVKQYLGINKAFGSISTEIFWDGDKKWNEKGVKWDSVISISSLSINKFKAILRYINNLQQKSFDIFSFIKFCNEFVNADVESDADKKKVYVDTTSYEDPYNIILYTTKKDSDCDLLVSILKSGYRSMLPMNDYIIREKAIAKNKRRKK